MNQVDAESHPNADVANAAAVVGLVERDGDDAGRNEVSTSIQTQSIQMSERKNSVLFLLSE